MAGEDFRGVQPRQRTGRATVSLTDSSGGTVSDTIVDVPATYTEATLANQIASLAGKINEILVVLRETGAID